MQGTTDTLFEGPSNNENYAEPNPIDRVQVDSAMIGAAGALQGVGLRTMEYRPGMGNGAVPDEVYRKKKEAMEREQETHSLFAPIYESMERVGNAVRAASSHAVTKNSDEVLLRSDINNALAHSRSITKSLLKVKERLAPQPTKRKDEQAATK